MSERFTVPIGCPWCGHGEVHATDRVKIRVSVMCAVCSNRYVADLYAMKAYRPKEEPKKKNRPMIMKLPCPCPGCRGYTETDGKADAIISLKCAKKHIGYESGGYSRYYQADLMTGETWPAPPIRKQGRNR